MSELMKQPGAPMPCRLKGSVTGPKAVLLRPRKARAGVLNPPEEYQYQ